MLLKLNQGTNHDLERKGSTDAIVIIETFSFSLYLLSRSLLFVIITTFRLYG